MTATGGQPRRWWGKRNQAESASAQASTEQVPPRPGIPPLSVEKFSAPALKKHCLVLVDVLSTAVKAKNGDFEDKARISKYVDRILTAALRLDPWRLSDANVRELTSAIYQLLPRAIEECTTNALEEDWSFARELTEDLFRRTYAAVNGVVRLQMDPEYLADFAQRETQVSESGVAVTWPVLAPFSAELDGAVKALEVKWELAAKMELGVEDRFLLDQIALSYLPDSWALLASFTVLGEDVRARAAAMVHEQLAILSLQVEDILARASVHSLSALKVQTDFIRAQQLNKEGPRLNLHASKTIELNHEPSASEV